MTPRKTNPAGTLVVIGGHEDKKGDRVILKAVASHVGQGRLVVMTVASSQPEPYFAAYRKVFAELGIGDTCEVYVHERGETISQELLERFEGATGVFFTGGDQLRITSQIGDTELEARVREVFRSGGVVAGTSAGASAMCETMLVTGSGRESYRIGDIRMAPGLGLIQGVIIDQHFAERGRMGRLLGAVAQNPRLLGIGIDEDTAIVVQGEHFDVIGSGAVTVVDGQGVSRSNVAEARSNTVLSMFDVRLHVLSSGDSFDLAKRQPVAREQAEE
ncbi:cyanophycinase [Deinococcus irradiatisoli]|uniref:Cyanophycinase n=1 Tax=Deinococcus irradiatisoli TaxID=2202254 RepID=A0A2Z3JKX5_9DEIO|nr:cyanophycinase [Deinococcus irradiatisoli]AWN23940.1 cyanophycinase [Deinococcus irradiatisoli]